jgi:hypothetical protein
MEKNDYLATKNALTDKMHRIEHRIKMLEEGYIEDNKKFDIGELVQVVFPAWEHMGKQFPERIDYGFVDGFIIGDGYEVVPTLLKRKLDGTPSKQPLYCCGAKFARINENN